MNALERNYQPKIIERLEREFPDCVVLKNDPGYLQGVPDLICLYRTGWVMLETKRTTNARRQPNQSYWVAKLNSMSFAAFIFPENEDDVFRHLHEFFDQA